MKILIAGDSWGCGEWSDEHLPFNLSLHNLGLTHNGLEQYLRDENFIVKNLSEPGCANQIIYRRLYFELKYNPNYWDKIIVFQTTPTRDLPWENSKKFSYDDLIITLDTFLNKFYIALNNLNYPIDILGGCSKVNTGLIAKYENLQSSIPSILEFLIPGFNQPRIWTDILQIIDKKNYSTETLEKIINETEILFNLSNLSPYFEKEPYHPDRLAHKNIFEFLKKSYLNPLSA